MPWETCTSDVNLLKLSVFKWTLQTKGRRKVVAFSTSAFWAVASWQQSEKVEHVCTTTNLPLSKGIKIVSVFQHLHGEIGRTNSDVQQRDGQIKR